MSTMAQRLLAVRKRAGKTQKEVADRLGITYQAYAQYERGIRNPKYGTIEKIAKALNCNISELLTPSEESSMIIDTIIENLGEHKRDPEASIDEDDFDDALAEQEQPGIVMQRYTEFTSSHPCLMQMIRDVGISLKIINWHQILISYNGDDLDVRISELQNDLEHLQWQFEYNVRSMLRNNYGFNIVEPEYQDSDDE